VLALIPGASASLLVAAPGTNTAVATSPRGLLACCALPVALAVASDGSLLVGSNAAGAAIGTVGSGGVAAQGTG
jgi:hypothetical protein